MRHVPSPVRRLTYELSKSLYHFVEFHRVELAGDRENTFPGFFRGLLAFAMRIMLRSYFFMVIERVCERLLSR